ncbi:hypothetical protein EV424DRAFT_1446109 [Suillus variegatus]|nr:hypothetical protein EV424DRAFT_1446109 [Suillus variegatus]
MSFLGRLPVSVVFNLESRRCLVSASIARSLGHSGVGSLFSEVLTASYEGRSLTTDAEFVVTRALDSDVVVGMNWIAAWRSVGLEDVISDPESRSCTYLQGDEISILKSTGLTFFFKNLRVWLRLAPIILRLLICCLNHVSLRPSPGRFHRLVDVHSR